MMESHTYINTAPAATSTTETVDADFITDANVYYNLPPPLPYAQCRGASLPRGRYSVPPQMARGSTSCPASPKFTTTSIACDLTGRRKGGGEVSHVKQTPAVRRDVQGENSHIPSPPWVSRDRVPKPRSKKLSYTRSFDLEHMYQNLVKVTSKPRSNSFSIDLPWRRRKKVLEAPPSTSFSTPAGIREDSEDTHIGTPHKADNLRESNRQYSPDKATPEPSSSSSSSSSDDGGADNCPDMRPGVTYRRKHHKSERRSTVGEVTNPNYHSTATLPLHSVRVPTTHVENSQAVDPRSVLDVNANLYEWLRKERWLEKKRYSRNFRSPTESGEVDISILHASDGAKWKNYLYEVFTQLVPFEERARGIRVEGSNVEEIEDDLGKLQALKLKGSKLQIVIVSPCFLEHVARHGNSELGQVFRPEKVLALLLGVNDSQLDMTHRSALYTYRDWPKLKVRDKDPSFVYEVLAEGVKILNNSALYSKYHDESSAKFRITPRKVTMMQQVVHIMLYNPVENKKDLKVLIEFQNEATVSLEKFKLRNPYTVEFKIPDEFMSVTRLLVIRVMVKKVRIGSRQIKCESPLDTLRGCFSNVAHPTLYICQALNINPLSDDLDVKMSEALRLGVPPCKFAEPPVEKCNTEFPTMAHFTAYYGLEKLTWTFLEIPAGEAVLNMTNKYGQTPSLIAFKNGFPQLAQKLEDAALIASLAAKMNYEPEHYKRICKAQHKSFAEETYSSPPPPRPLASPLYDHPPSPREAPQPNTQTEDAKSVSDLPTPQSQHISTSTLSAQSDTEKDGQYLKMKATQDYRESELHEYSEEVYSLVTAWLKRTNVEEFVEKHQEEIGEVKSQLDLRTTREEKHSGGGTPGAASLAPDKKDAVADLKKHEKTAEEFFTLIKGGDSVFEQPKSSVEVTRQRDDMAVDPRDKSPPSTVTSPMEDELTPPSSSDSESKTPKNKKSTKSPMNRLPEPPSHDKQQKYLEPSVCLYKDSEVNACIASRKHSPRLHKGSLGNQI